MRVRLAAAAAASLACLGAVAAPASAEPVGTPQVIASGLEVPWDVVALPDGRRLISERPGRIRELSAGGTLRPEPVYADATARKFLGLVADPGYASNGLLYLYVNRPSGSRVERLQDTGTGLVADGVPFPGPIATDGNHDGGRMGFGPDGKLYVTTGDIHDPELPQDRQSLNGKILRMNPDGSAPADNPFVAEGGNARYVWSFGHRHPQGLAWDDRGRLWETEHGPSGERYDPARFPGGSEGRGGRDELNLIVRGGNYGWPVISGEDTRAGMITPVATSGAAATWAPGGLAYAADGKLYAPFLRGARVQQFTLDAGAGVAAQKELYTGTYGRLRAATYDACRGTLVFTADGADAAVYAVPIDPEGRDVPFCAFETTRVPPPAPAPAAPPVVSGGPPSPPAATDRARAHQRAAVRRLRVRLGRAVRRTGLRRLAAGRRVSARAGGFGQGRLVVRLSVRERGKLRPLATLRRSLRDRKTITVRLRSGRKARARLRRATRRTLTVTVAFVPANGPRLLSTSRVRVRR